MEYSCLLNRISILDVILFKECAISDIMLMGKLEGIGMGETVS